MNPAASSSPVLRKKKRVTPVSTGTADPRPVTTYVAVHSVVASHSRITVTLAQPCIIRQPRWPAIDTTAGGLVAPSSSTVVSPTQFYLDFAGLLNGMVAFIEVPYQDEQVQNFQGGFVRPGGQWFRTPQTPD